VQSKSEAIRRLVQIGLRLEREIPKLFALGNSVTGQLETALKNAMDMANGYKNDGTAPVEGFREISLMLFQRAEETLVMQTDLMEHLLSAADEIAPLVSNPKLTRALKAAERVKVERDKGEALLAKIMAQVEEKAKKKGDDQ